MTLNPSHPVTAAAAADAGRSDAWRRADSRERRADARADLRDVATPVLLADLADCRADLAQPLPPPWWLDTAIRAGRVRAELRRRGEAT